MPGPISDSYDPEFGAGANADDVRDAIRSVIDKIGTKLGPGLEDIVQVARHKHGSLTSEIRFQEREMRLIRFAMLRSLESI